MATYAEPKPEKVLLEFVQPILALMDRDAAPILRLPHFRVSYAGEEVTVAAEGQSGEETLRRAYPIAVQTGRHQLAARIKQTGVIPDIRPLDG